MMRKFIAWLFGPCAAYGHQWVDISGTPEEIAAAEEAYKQWFDDYPIGTYPTPPGRTECSVCGELKPPSRGFGRPSGYHPGWG